MAILGAQLVITLVMVSFLQKVMPYFSFSRWILCRRLVRYLHPSDETLQEASGISRNNSSGRRNKKESRSNLSHPSNNKNGFNVSRNIDVQLEVAPIQPVDIVHLHYYPEFHWLTDFSISTFFVYILTEVYYYWSPSASNEINLSMLWAFLVILFSLKILGSLAASYFKNEETQGEMSMTLICGAIFFLISMIVLVADEEILEFGLDEAHENLSKMSSAVLTSHKISAIDPSSKLTFRFALAVWSGIIGALFTFPGIRCAKMHVDSLRYSEGSYFTRSLLHLNMLSMIVSVLMWIKPIARDYLTLKWSSDHDRPLMDDEWFNTTRIIVLLSIASLRLLLMPDYLQAYLNLAHDKIKQLKKEAGKINSLELQRRVARIFYYLCVAALQYIAPVLIFLNLGLMTKTLGAYSWYPDLLNNETLTMRHQNASVANQTTLNIMSIFTPVLFRGVLNYATWWCCTTISLTTGIGFVYYIYFGTS